MSGCAVSYIQVFNTSSTNLKEKSDYFFYENDSVKIIYSFWASKGVMSFSVLNKVDKPIYIDWKNSSFIYNGNKLNYWSDEIQSFSQSVGTSTTTKNTNVSSFYNGYYYFGPSLLSGTASGKSTISSNALTNTSSETYGSMFKPERVTFIPPRSTFSCSRFYLLPIDHYKPNPKHVQKTIEPRNDQPSASTEVYSENFDYEASPLKFRNYLAFSFAENSSSFFFVDNEFYLTSVLEMDYRHFRGRAVGRDENGITLYEKPFKKPSSYYIYLGEYRTVK